MLFPYINKRDHFLIGHLSCLVWFLDFVSYLFSNINPAVCFKHMWKLSVHESNEVPVVSVRLERRCYSAFVLLSPLKCITERSPAAVSHSPSLILFLFNSVERLIPVRVSNGSDAYPRNTELMVSDLSTDKIRTRCDFVLSPCASRFSELL